MGTKFTPTHNIAHPDGQYAVDPESYLTALAQSVDSGLTSAIGTAATLTSAPAYASGTNLDNITTGEFGTAAPTIDTILNAPPGAITGFVHTLVNPSNPELSRIQVYYELNTGGRIWTRFRGSSSWTAWERLGDPSRVDTPRPAVGTNLDNEAADGRGRAILVFPGVDSITNAPEDANGVCRTWVNRTAPTTSRLQMFYEFNTGRRIWSRFRGSGGWTDWARVDAAYAIEQAAGGGEGAGTPSALKTLPLILTASTSAAPETVATGSVRFPFNVNAPIPRWRLHVRNHNDYNNTTYTGGAAFTGLWVGPRSGNSAGFASAPTQALPAFTLPAGGAEYVSPWVSDVPLGDGVERLLSLGWTGATGQNAKSAAGAYRSTNSATGGSTSSTGYVLGSDAPFSWWLEVETIATTPVVAIWGDSISAGTGNTLPIHDSPLSQYCRRIGGLPYHAALPGSMMLSWEPTGATHPTWERWAGLSRPDAVIHFMGQNDLLNAGTLAEMQRRFEATLPLVGKHLSQNIYVATITPSSSKTEAQHAVRRAYNDWLETRPLGVRDVFDFSAAVGNASDDALLPEYATDTTHLNTAGSAVLAATITRPVTSVSAISADGALAAYLNEIN